MRSIYRARLPRTHRLTIAFFAICCTLTGAAQAIPVAAGEQSSRVIAIGAGNPIAFNWSLLRAPLWTLEASAMLTQADAEPAVFGDGTVFSGERYGPGEALRAVDERSGKIRWSTDLIGSPTAFAGDTVLAVAQAPDGQHAVALDSRTGYQRWNVPGTSVTLIRQLAIVTNGLHLEAHDARSGELRWSSPWNGYAPHDVRLIGRTLLLRTIESGATMVGVLYAYNVLDGRPLWVRSNVNAIMGVDGEKAVAADVTWGPGAYANYEPLSADTIALSDGKGQATSAFAPDPNRWKTSADMDVHFARDAATDGTALVFRIGPATVYRYSRMDAATLQSPTRYELGTIARAGSDTWLTRLPDGGAGVAHLDPAHASVQRLTGLDGIEFTGVYDGLAFVAARDRAVVFDPLHPADAVVSRFPCTTVTRAFRGDGMLVAVCSQPKPSLVALALPATASAQAIEMPLPIQTQGRYSFDATIVARELPMKFLRARGAAFSADGTLWFCQHAAFTGGANGHTDFIGRLMRNGTIDEFPVPTDGANVVSIARGSDGAMWFTESSAVKLGRIAADGSITEYALPAALDRNPIFPRRPIPTPMPIPSQRPSTAMASLSRAPARMFEKLGGIASGADGALWVTAPFARAVARVTTNGDVHVFALPSSLLYPGHIARGPDAALWLTTRDAIVRLALDGGTRTYPLNASGITAVTSLVWGPDGNLWFSFFDGRAGRITAHGETRIFSAPVVAAPSGPLIGGCDGALYEADRFRPALWRLTTAGEFVEHDAPFAIENLARAPDCSLGATESQAPNVGHVGTIVLPRR